jgi:hypothetical protein
MFGIANKEIDIILSIFFLNKRVSSGEFVWKKEETKQSKPDDENTQEQRGV